jgi:hypothetical protein
MQPCSRGTTYKGFIKISTVPLPIFITLDPILLTLSVYTLDDVYTLGPYIIVIEGTVDNIVDYVIAST